MEWIKEKLLMSPVIPFFIAGYLYELARSGFNAGVWWRKEHQNWLADR